MKKRCRRSGKVKFDSHESAATRAGEILTKAEVDSDAPPFLSTYLCEFCGKWHITKGKNNER